MSSKKIKHHYVPHFLLAGFTDLGTKKGTLCCFDKDKIKQFQERPSNVAFEKNLYTVNIEGIEELVETDLFSSLEVEAARIIREIIETHQMPKKGHDDYDVLMEFLCFQRYRTLQFKETLNDITNQIPSSDFTQDVYLSGMVTFVEETLPCFTERNWSIYIIDNDSNHFISCDNPVCLDWIDPTRSSEPCEAPCPSSVKISVALSKKVAIVGLFKEEAKIYPSCTRHKVAEINSLTEMNAKRFIFSCYKNFYTFDKTGQLQIVTEKERVNAVS